MREIHKKIALPLGGAPQEFRLTKLDAFSGARLLKLLSAATTDDLQALLLSLPDDVLEALQRTCLRSASVLLPAILRDFRKMLTKNAPGVLVSEDYNTEDRLTVIHVTGERLTRGRTDRLILRSLRVGSQEITLHQIIEGKAGEQI
jgi:hypothetical protein